MGQLKPFLVRLPERHVEFLRTLPNASQFIRQALAEKIERTIRERFILHHTVGRVSATLSEEIPLLTVPSHVTMMPAGAGAQPARGSSRFGTQEPDEKSELMEIGEHK